MGGGGQQQQQHHYHHKHHHHHHKHHHHHPRQPPTRSWLLTNPGVEVEGETDMYWCKVFRRPQLREKNHVIRYEPIFTPGNQQHVHHIIVYECTDIEEGLKEEFEQLAAGQGHGCTETIMLKYIRTCNHVVVAWAVGSEGLSLPSEAGYPLTPKGPNYYLMETHYDNPSRKYFTDESGIRITYTPELRFYDAGVLSVGLDPNWKHLIPPHQRTVLSEGHCVAECTNAAFPPTGINVFAVILHTHLLGRSVRVRHIRQGRELEPIARDNNYDFNYQEYRALHTPRTVLPGDHLIGECTYNSWERSTITLGGFKTRDEMCLSFLFYWPRVDLSLCHSKPSLNTVLHSLGIEELAANSNPIKIRRPIELAGKTLEWRLTNYNWTLHFDSFQHTTHTGTFNPMCWRRGLSLISEVEERDYEYPNVTEPWKPENVCRRRRGKNRRRQYKNKGRSRSREDEDEEGNATADGDDGEQAGEDGEEEDVGEEDHDGEVMVDDQINSRPIQRIDVDPAGHIDVFMPVVEERYEGGGGVDDFTGDNLPPQDLEDPELQEEFQEMEKELEQEMAGMERTASINRSGAGGSGVGSISQRPSSLVLWTVCAGITVFRLAWLAEGHG
ncbi:hypothetical protein Pmani_025590 [Petrolisthes manimaculis]|uniref:Uncharacterized protein n=1 Tax=Petrolisthes manimaculis TaxID=1843537 RepID=A0AAE1U109_9EUCA|nr:hypothetical protein Pmani_025590 [Petrolisthes manimaculis]